MGWATRVHAPVFWYSRRFPTLTERINRQALIFGTAVIEIVNERLAVLRDPMRD